MASEDIGSLYPTKIPGYSDAADIQAALRLYHYGDAEYDISNTNAENIPANSVAGAFKSIEDRVLTIETLGSPVSVSTTEPVNPVDGFLWVNENLNVYDGGFFGNVIEYSTSAPDTYLTDGRLWAKKGTTPVELYIYDASTTSWKRMG